MSSLARKVSLFAVAAAGVALTSAALSRADSSDTPSLSELRDREHMLEEHHEHALHSVDERLQTQSIDADAAVMERAKINNEYRNEMNSLQSLETQAYRELDARTQRPSSSESRAPANNAAVPHFQSQSVITYPQNGDPDAPAPEEKPSREGSQKNVGFGTRELSF